MLKNVNLLSSTEHLLIFCLTMKSNLSFLLDPTFSFKDLGVILDRKLSFHDHIDAIISISMAILGFLKRNSSEFSLRSLYVSLVRPHLEYCAILWNPVYSSHYIRIERV